MTAALVLPALVLRPRLRGLAAIVLRPRFRGLAAIALPALAVSAALAGCGGSGASTVNAATTSSVVLTTGGTSHTQTTAGTGHSPTATTSAVAHGARVVTLGKAMTKAFKGMGPAVGALVVDLSGGSRLYALRASVARPPASVEKLYTTMTLLGLLGPDATLSTRLLGTGYLGKGGVWHGNLYLEGGGDPTFGDGNWNKLEEDGYGPTATELVAQLAKRGIKRVTGRLYADASLFDGYPGGPATGDKPDIPDYGGELSALVYDHGLTAKGLGPAAFTAHQVVATMKVQGIRAVASRATRDTPADAQLLGEVASPPVKTMVRLMDVPSDDLFADLFAKQLGVRFAGHGTLLAGAGVIREFLASRYGLHPRLFDGSGLDKADRSTPAEVVSLLEQVYGTADGRILWNALPVVGREGTVQSIGVKTFAAGRCVAKTGTLDNVTNLAGYCRARGGHALAFAMFIDGPSNWPALVALSKAVGAIADY